MRAEEVGAQVRTQSSLAVSADDRRWLLLNDSPDLRQQNNSNPPPFTRKTAFAIAPYPGSC